MPKPCQTVSAFAMAVLLLTLSPSRAAAAASNLPCGRADPESPRPRVGLVLGGGGARGIAHVAVIKELERLHVPIDCIAGTSMGSLVGGLYASGMPIADIEALVRDLDWQATLDDSLERPERSFRRKRDDDLALLPRRFGVGEGGVRLSSGVLAGERIMLLFERATAPVAHVRHFDDLPIPYRAVATDLNTGEAVVLDSGSLPDAMRASMSIPAVFSPVVIDGRTLVDGGMAEQVPVSVARAMGADIVIAVDVGTPLMKLDAGSSALAIASQLTGFLTVSNTAASVATLGPNDVLIRPDLGDRVTTGGFDKALLALEIGAQAVAAPEVQARLAALAQPGAAAPQDVANRRTAPPVIGFIRVDNASAYSDATLLAHLDVPVGQPLDHDRLEAGIRTIYGFDTFDLVEYDLVEENGVQGLVLKVRPKRTGPRYLEAGLTLVSDFGGNLTADLRGGVLFSPVNGLGGEVRVLAQVGSQHALVGEWYQPLDPRGDWFAGVRGGYERPIVSDFNADGDRLATYGVPTTGIHAYVGRSIGHAGALALTLRREQGRLDLQSGSALRPEPDFDNGDATLALTLDRLDSLYVPREGYFLSLGETASRKGLGADVDYDRYDIDAIYAKAWGPHSAFGGLRMHETVDGAVPFQAQYRLGGLTRLAGYAKDELVTENYRLGFVGYTYELGSVLGRSAVVGGTLEYADLWDDAGGIEVRRHESSASGWFGFDSWLGRLILGYATRHDGDGVLFLELGQIR